MAKISATFNNFFNNYIHFSDLNGRKDKIRIDFAYTDVVKKLRRGDKIQFEISTLDNSKYATNIQHASGTSFSIDISKLQLSTNKAPKKVSLSIVDEKKSEKSKTEVETKTINYNPHFYLVFNPMFNSSEDNEEYQGKTQAHSFYELLRQKNIKSKEKNESSYLYWGKLKVSSGLEPLDYDLFKQVVDANKALNLATHLYISDFQHIWVAKVDDILKEIPDPENTLNFYKRNKSKVEAWFKISDMGLICATHEDCLKGLSRLSLNHSLTKSDLIKKNNEINPYLSNLRYPLIVEDKSKTSYFENNNKWILKESSQVLMDSASAYTKHVVNSYVIPATIFDKLPPTVKEDILYTEASVINRRQTDNTKAALRETARTYYRILESVINEIAIKPLLKYQSSYLKAIDDSNLKKAIEFEQGLTLPQIYSLIFDNKQETFNRVLVRFFDSHPQITKTLKEILIDYKNNDRDARNDLVHGDCDIPETKLHQIREKILGVGQEGLINQLYKSMENNKDHGLKQTA